MIELGGFWSYYSLWFLKGFPERRAVVLEPDPAHIEIDVRTLPLTIELSISFKRAWGADNLPSHDFSTETSGIVQIPQLSVPHLLERFQIGQLDILHCDTQGAETSVISSCEDLIKAKRITFGIFSTHAFQISGDPLTHQKCLQMLKDFGASILAEHDVHESFSGDGLVAAYFGAEPLRWNRPSLSYNRYSNGIFRNPIFDLAEAWQRPISSPLERQISEGSQVPAKGWLAKILKRQA